MTKRISCKVVRSVPLGKSSEVLRDANLFDNKHHNIGNIGVVDVQPGPTDNWVSYTGQLGRAKVSADNDPMGQILNCYV